MTNIGLYAVVRKIADKIGCGCIRENAFKKYVITILGTADDISFIILGHKCQRCLFPMSLI